MKLCGFQIGGPNRQFKIMTAEILNFLGTYSFCSLQTLTNTNQNIWMVLLCVLGKYVIYWIDWHCLSLYHGVHAFVEHLRPERPPHLHPEMLHPALREKGRAIVPPSLPSSASPLHQVPHVHQRPPPVATVPIVEGRDQSIRVSLRIPHCGLLWET